MVRSKRKCQALITAKSNMNSKKGKAAEIKPEAFQLACLYLQDQQRYIAAGKVQRWEVMKWAVTVNLALAAASAATDASKWALFGFCILVSITSIYLLYHYNHRITEVRKAADEIMDRLLAEHPDIEKFVGHERYPTEQDELKKHDKQEMTLFYYVIGFSILPAFYVAVSYRGPLSLH
jgi:hypothetical protein